MKPLRRSASMSNPRLLAAVAGTALLATAVIAGSGAVADDAADLLPDLGQEAPRDVVISAKSERVRVRGKLVRRKVVRLGFTSQVDNIGSGPFIVDGTRRSTRQKTMRTTQWIMRTDGSRRKVAVKSPWYYERNKDHEHWHFSNFDVFSLFDRSGVKVAKSGKQGFCLGDRGKGVTTLPNAVAQPVFTGHCLLKKPRALKVSGGISVGWGDDYQAYLEGQSIVVTGLDPGVYCLHHRATSAFVEPTRDNNTAVALVQIDPRAVPPTVNVVSSLSVADGVAAPSCAQAYQLAGL